MDSLQEIHTNVETELRPTLFYAQSEKHREMEQTRDLMNQQKRHRY